MDRWGLSFLVFLYSVLGRGIFLVPLKDWLTSLCVLRNPVVLVVSKYVFSRCELSPTPRPQPGGPAVLILGCSSPRLASVLPLSAVHYSAPRPTALTGWQAYCLATWPSAPFWLLKHRSCGGGNRLWSLRVWIDVRCLLTYDELKNVLFLENVFFKLLKQMFRPVMNINMAWIHTFRIMFCRPCIWNTH
jgi:hypothetical protein